MKTKTVVLIFIAAVLLTGGRILVPLLVLAIALGSICYLIEKVTGIDLIRSILRHGG